MSELYTHIVEPHGSLDLYLTRAPNGKEYDIGFVVNGCVVCFPGLPLGDVENIAATLRSMVSHFRFEESEREKGGE